MNRVMLLHGGGYDSTALLASYMLSVLGHKNPIGDELVAYADDSLAVGYAKYGHLAQDAEQDYIHKQVVWFESATFMCLDRYAFNVGSQIQQVGQLFTGNHDESPEVVGRNAAILEAAANYADVLIIGLAPELYTPLPDANPDYIATWTKEYNEKSDRGLKVVHPLTSLTYDQYMDLLADLINHPVSSPIMDRVMTCWTPIYERKKVYGPMEFYKHSHCGKCAHCKKRERILEHAAKRKITLDDAAIEAYHANEGNTL